MFDVDYYALPDGTKPVEEFIDNLPDKMRSKAFYSIAVLEEYGNALREPFSKPMGDGLFELRINFSSDITRIFYFFVTGRRIILTNGFVKKSMKTPPEEIDRARRYKADYERRYGNE